MNRTTPSAAPRSTGDRELTLDELQAVAGGMTNGSRGLAPDPHKPDLVDIILGIIRKLA